MNNIINPPFINIKEKANMPNAPPNIILKCEIKKRTGRKMPVCLNNRTQLKHP